MAAPADLLLAHLALLSWQTCALVGPRTAEQLRDTIRCLDFTLTDEQRYRLHKVSKIDMGFPHTFLFKGYPGTWKNNVWMDM